MVNATPPGAANQGTSRKRLSNEPLADESEIDATPGRDRNVAEEPVSLTSEQDLKREAADKLNEQIEGYNVSPADVKIQDGKASLTENARKSMAAQQINEQTPTETTEADIQQTGDGYELKQSERREIAAESISEQVKGDVDPSDLERTGDGYALNEQAQNQLAERRTARQRQERGVTDEYEQADELTRGGFLTEEQEQAAGDISLASDLAEWSRNQEVAEGNTLGRIGQGATTATFELLDAGNYIRAAETGTELVQNLPSEAIEDPKQTKETVTTVGGDIVGAQYEYAKENPARFAGSFAPEAALILATGGAAAASKASRASRVSRLARADPDISTTGALRKGLGEMKPGGGSAKAFAKKELDPRVNIAGDFRGSTTSAVKGGISAASKRLRRTDTDVDPVKTGRSDVGTEGVGTMFDPDAVDKARGISGPSKTSRVRGEIERALGRKPGRDVPEYTESAARMGPSSQKLKSFAGDERGSAQMGGLERRGVGGSDPDAPEFRDYDADVDPRTGQQAGGFEDVRQDALTQRQDFLEGMAERERAATERGIDPDVDPLGGGSTRTMDPDTGDQFDRYGDPFTEPMRTPDVDTDTPMSAPKLDFGRPTATDVGALSLLKQAQQPQATQPDPVTGRVEDTTVTPDFDTDTDLGQLDRTRTDVDTTTGLFKRPRDRADSRGATGALVGLFPDTDRATDVDVREDTRTDMDTRQDTPVDVGQRRDPDIPDPDVDRPRDIDRDIRDPDVPDPDRDRPRDIDLPDFDFGGGRKKKERGGLFPAGYRYQYEFADPLDADASGPSTPEDMDTRDGFGGWL